MKFGICSATSLIGQTNIIIPVCYTGKIEVLLCIEKKTTMKSDRKY